jgi:hypothetical protein
VQGEDRDQEEIWEPVQPVREPEAEVAEVEIAEAEVAEAAEEPGTGRADADLIPWELPSTAAPGTSGSRTWESSRPPEPRAGSASEPEPVGYRDEEDFFSFDAFFSDADASEKKASASEARPASEPSTPEVGPEPAAAEEDDDLESFQAWLRSLKR